MHIADRSTDLDRAVRFYESLTRAALGEVAHIYAPQAFFKDPFNEVRGRTEITRIFDRMFDQVLDPRFSVGTRAVQGDDAFLTWDFRFRMKRFSGAEQCIRGATHLSFDADSLIVYHRDYWDAAEDLYEKLPAIGAFMRVLKRAAQH